MNDHLLKGTIFAAGSSVSGTIATASTTVHSKEFVERTNALISNRLEARKAKNWAESDRIRDELAAMGIAIKDNKDGTTSWEVKR